MKQQVPACKNSPDLVGTWRAKRLSQGWEQVYNHQGVWAHSYAEQDKQHMLYLSVLAAIKVLHLSMEFRTKTSVMQGLKEVGLHQSLIES